jgi:hypothetical protein
MLTEAFVAALKSARVAVIGDVMVDHYVYGAVQRISPEAPVPVLHVAGERYVLGGAANVAANAAVNVDACPAGVLAAVEGDGVGKGPDLLEEDGRRLAFPENRIELSNAHETVVQPACGRRDLPGQRQLPTRREVLERRVHSGAIPLGERQE